MNDVVLVFGDLRITFFHLLVVLGGFAVLCLSLALAAFASARRARFEAAIRAEEQADELDLRLGEITRLQAEMTGRMQTMAEVFGSRQADLARGLGERLDGLGHRLGHSLTDTTRVTVASLGQLNERLAVIDRAQRGITDLSSQVVQLQSILSNKQARGAFGQGRMEAIVADALPGEAFTFQATLSTGVRPDCLIVMPNGAPGLVVDAKFPLEGWTAFRAAETAEARAAAATGFRRDVLRHVGDIRGKYFLPGETQDTALLFVPSEAIFADLHEHFDDVVQRAHRARVVIVSPSLLLLSIQVVQSVLRDTRLREHAHVIQAEVGHLVADVERLAERVAKVQSHFSQTARDLDQIAISSDKVVKRAGRIESLDLGTEPAQAPLPFVPRRAGE